MKLQENDIELYRGDDEQYVLSLVNDEGVISLDNVRFDLHAVANQKIVLELSTENNLITVEKGEVTLHFNHNLTEQADWRVAKYDLQMTDALGKVKTVLVGKIMLTADITKI